MPYSKADFDLPFCQRLMEEHRTVDACAKAIAPECVGFHGQPVVWGTVKQWIAPHVGPRQLLAQANAERENRIAAVLDRASVPAEAVRVKKIIHKEWGVAAKNNDGEIVTEGMFGTTVISVPVGDEAEALIEVPHPSIVVAYKPAFRRATDTQRVFICGDLQIGFWAVLDPRDSQRFSFVPFHNEDAIDIMMQAMALYAPTTVVIVGDFFDFPQLSRFQQEPQWAQTMQATVDYGEALIAKIRRTVGDDCKMVFCPGNHETRMQRAIVNNIPALYELRRRGEKFAMYSVEGLLRLEHHNVEVLAEFPSGQYWIASQRGSIPGLVVTHADPKKRDMRADSIHGHLVLPGIETFAREYESGWVTYTRMTVSGCANYSDSGDRVRLTRTNTPSGRSRMASVPSFGTVDIDNESGQRSYGLHLMRAGAVQFLGKILTAKAQTEEAA